MSVSENGDEWKWTYMQRCTRDVCAGWCGGAGWCMTETHCNATAIQPTTTQRQQHSDNITTTCTNDCTPTHWANNHTAHQGVLGPASMHLLWRLTPCKQRRRGKEKSRAAVHMQTEKPLPLLYGTPHRGQASCGCGGRGALQKDAPRGFVWDLTVWDDG